MLARSAADRALTGVLFLVGLLALAFTSSAFARQPYQVQECAVSGTAPTKAGGAGTGFATGLGSGIVIGPDDIIWATRPDAALTKITMTGKISTVPLPSGAVATSLAVDRQGDIWFTSERGQYEFGEIGELTPSTGEIRVFDAAEGQNPDRYTVAPSAIAEGPDGAMYFAEAYLPEIGRISGGSVEQISAPSQFSSMATGPDGQLWFGEYAAQALNVGARWNSNGGFTYFPGDARVYVSGVAVTTDGTGWFAAPRHFNGQWDQGPQRIVLTKVGPSGEISTVLTQGSKSNRPKGLTASDDGALWLTSDSQAGPGFVWRISASGRQTRIVGSTMPTNQVALGAITQGPDGAMWFLNLSRGSIGRISKTGTKALKCKPAKVPSWAVQH